MNIFNWIKSIFQKTTTVDRGVVFPNTITKEYEQQKRHRETKALTGCEFFKPLNIDFSENIQFLHENKCPYCKSELPERKGKTYKCPKCNNKIYRLNDIITDFEGLFTETQKQIRNDLKTELNRRKKFLKIYKSTQELIKFIPCEYENDNIVSLILSLQLAKRYIKKPKHINQLRMCRFYEGELCNLIPGYETQAINAFLTVLYIDLIGNYCELYDNPDFNKEELAEDGLSKWSNSFIAPGIYERAFKDSKNIGDYEQVFKFNAENLIKTVKYKLPITPDEAWQKLLEYSKTQ